MRLGRAIDCSTEQPSINLLNLVIDSISIRPSFFASQTYTPSRPTPGQILRLAPSYAMGSVCAAFVLHEVALAVDLLRQGILCDVRLRLRALERPQRHLGSLAFLADASTHEEILLPIWPDVCHYDGWSPNISARDRVPTVAKSVDFAPRDYRKPARWGQTN